MPAAGALQEAVLGWYRAEGRVLAFRETRDPYAILVSEVMAQQTQIARVVERWAAFLERFPSFEALAAATPADVLRAWKGLGYDRRALNLWRCARVVVDELGGQLPRDVAALERLPGIGPYTARALAALAFGAPVGAVDVNVRRVIGRVVAGRQAASMSTREVQSVADELVPSDSPGEWTHALMDLGATFCRARAPRCEACPARQWCRYAADPPPVAETKRQVRAARASPVHFSSTTRWLRGRILDRLRAATKDDWIVISDGIAEHPHEAVERALAALEREGLIEVAGMSPPMARLATTSLPARQASRPAPAKFSG